MTRYTKFTVDSAGIFYIAVASGTHLLISEQFLRVPLSSGRKNVNILFFQILKSESHQSLMELRNFPESYGTRRFIAVFTRALNWYLSCVFPVVSFLMAFPPISHMHLASPAFVPHALPTSSSLT
jgi:hypothetical protein